LNHQTIVFSGRVEYNNATVGDLAPEFFDAVATTDQQQINPTISIGYLTDIFGELDLSIWAGRSQRSGSMTERYINYFPVGLDPFELLGNPSLNPEVNNQVDLSLEYTSKEILVSFNVFGSLLENYITGVIREDLTPRLPMSPGVRQFENSGAAYKTGLEISYNHRFTSWLSQNIDAAYVYARFDDGSPLPEIPPFDLRYRLTGSILSGKLQPDITVRAVAAQMRVNREFGEVSTPSFATIGAGVSYEPTQKLQLSVRAENLLDEEYYEHLNRTDRLRSGPLFAPGRSFIFSASYRF
jgi:iron complex outermembrane receptor protein